LNIGARLSKLEEKQEQLLGLLTSFISANAPDEAEDIIDEGMPDPCTDFEKLKKLEVELAEKTFRTQMVIMANDNSL
jgi:hypothetical protein